MDVSEVWNGALSGKNGVKISGLASRQMDVFPKARLVFVLGRA